MRIQVPIATKFGLLKLAMKTCNGVFHCKDFSWTVIQFILNDFELFNAGGEFRKVVIKE